MELLSIDEPGHTYTIRNVQELFQQEYQEVWSFSVLNKTLGKEYSKQKATFEDPRKWLPRNCVLKNFLQWRLEIPPSLHYHVKVFDECRVNRTNLGNLVIWAQQGRRPIRERYHRDIVVESWTVTVLTVLDDTYPLVYTVTPNSSNGDHFISFIQACLPHIFPGDILFGNNCTFHTKGWSSTVARVTVAAIGAEYRLLPKYCPA